MGRRSAALCLLALSALPTGAAAQALKAELVGQEFVEDHTPEVSVSGNVLVGLMTAEAAEGLASDSLSLAPAGALVSKELCLRVSSRDGTYTSKNLYRVPEALDRSAVGLPYPSRYLTVVEQYGVDDVALAASAGRCDESARDYFVVMSAGQQPANLRLYVNSFGATDVLHRTKEGGEWSTPTPCNAITAKRRTTFDHVCDVKARGGATALDIEILRERFGRPQPTVALRVHRVAGGE